MTAEPSGLAFVDTNVLVYAYDASAGARHRLAEQLIGALGTSRQGALSVQVLQEFFVNVTRKIARPLAPDTAIGRLEILSRWTVHTPDAVDVVGAAQLARDGQLSFWDAMIVRSAQRLGCDTLWTEDLNAGQTIHGVTIRNPFDSASAD